MSDSARYSTLDGLRGIAALAVVLLHATEILGSGYTPPSAHLAVDFFFCLSGFVVAHAYEDKLVGSMSLWAFLRERAIRLMPLALFGALAGGGVLLARAALFHDVPVARILAATALNAALLPTSVISGLHNGAYPVNPVLWSLFFEGVINVAFGLVVLRLTTVRLAWIVAISAMLTAWTAQHFGTLDIGWDLPNFLGGFPRVLFPFAAGVLLRRLPPWGNKLAPVIPLALAALLFGPGLSGAGEAVAVLLLIPALVYVGAGAQPSRADSLARWLGAMSYPVYVIHHPAIRVISNVAKLAHVHAVIALIAASFIAALFAAYLLDRFYDKPVRRWLGNVSTRFTESRARRATPEVAG